MGEKNSQPIPALMTEAVHVFRYFGSRCFTANEAECVLCLVTHEAWMVFQAPN